MANELTVMNGDFYFNGKLLAKEFQVPTSAVTNNSVIANADIESSKLEQRINKHVTFSNHASAPTAERRGIHRVYGATGSILKFGVTASVIAGSASSITVDLKKNGTTILASTITLDNTTAVNVLKEPAGYTSPDLIQGDILEVEITAVTGATPPKGVTAWLVATEKAL